MCNVTIIIANLSELLPSINKKTIKKQVIDQSNEFK